jgi:hypothetical protein
MIPQTTMTLPAIWVCLISTRTLIGNVVTLPMVTCRMISRKEAEYEHNHICNSTDDSALMTLTKPERKNNTNNNGPGNKFQHVSTTTGISIHL